VFPISADRRQAALTLGTMQNVYKIGLVDNGATIIQLIESLGHELSGFRTQAVARFDGIDERLDILSSLDRRAGLIQSRSRITVRQTDWNERVDKSLERIAKRLTKLESKGQPEPPPEGSAQ
jgi:hypothetical protein